MRMKMPLFVVWSAQNSALIWKSLYEFFESRKPPLPLSATMTPSSERQLASPTCVQLFRLELEPSSSVTHPDSEPDRPAHPTASTAMTSSPAVIADQRFIVILLR